MKDKILAKMEAHVNSILDKPIITDNEYVLISGYLSKLEMDEQKAENEKRAAESQEQLKKSMMAVWGGAGYGV